MTLFQSEELSEIFSKYDKKKTFFEVCYIFINRTHYIKLHFGNVSTSLTL